MGIAAYNWFRGVCGYPHPRDLKFLNARLVLDESIGERIVLIKPSGPAPRFSEVGVRFGEDPRVDVVWRDRLVELPLPGRSES